MSDKELTRAGQAQELAIQPPVDVFEDASGITLIADIPGANTDSLSLKTEGNQLQLEAMVTTPMPPDLDSAWAEIRTPHYRHAFQLSPELDIEHIDAVLKDGVLCIRIPKTAQAQPRRIVVQRG